MKLLIYIPLFIILLTGCSFDLGNLDSDEEEVIVVKRYEYDDDNDIKSYFEDDVLKWTEEYDFNSSNQCIFMAHKLTSGTTLWSYIYSWEGNNLKSRSYFDIDNTLSTLETYFYNENDKINLHANYDNSSALQSFKTYLYTDTDKINRTISYNNLSEIEWAYLNEYDTNDKVSRSSSYSDSGSRIAYIDYSYFNDDEYKREGFGDTKTSDSFISNSKSFSFPAYGGVNITSRNINSLETPEIPTSPTAPSFNYTDDELDYTWMKLWEEDDWGSSYVILNSNYLPTNMERTVPEYLDETPIKIDISYTGTRVDSKKTSYNGDDLLLLEFEYNEDNYPITIKTSGELLYIPLNYHFTYSESGIPTEFAVYNQDTMLQKFVYTYTSDTSEISIENFSSSISTITHYDGDDKLVGTYVFTYDSEDNQITIDTLDPDGIDTGEIVILFNDDGNTTSLKSYSACGEKVWDYSYSYDEYQNRVSELNFNEDDVPEVISSFDIETLFDDIKRYLPTI